MKKTTLTITLLLFSIFNYAQQNKGFYLSFNTGYNLESNKQNNQVIYGGNPVPLISSNQISDAKSDFSVPSFSLGKGFNAQANVGYQWNQNIGLELGINYLWGGKTNFKQTSYNGNFTNTSISSTMLQFKPALVLQTQLEKINLYTKIGAVVGTGSIIIEQTEHTNFSNSTLKETMDGGLAFGYQGSLGVSYPLNDKISLFGELNLVSLNYAPTKGIFNEFTTNGIDQLAGMDINEKEFEYVKTINDDLENVNAPTKLIKTTYSYSSIGMNVGIKYSLK